MSQHHTLTPSDLHSLRANISAIQSETPYLNVSWTVSGSGAIKELKATFLRLQIIKDGIDERTFSVRCDYKEPFENASTPNGQLWKYYYDKFLVEPHTDYFISAFNIPTANPGDDAPSHTVSFTSPGCDKSIMKHSVRCIERGSLWSPNISACIVEKNVEVNFTLYNYGTKYVVLLYNCSSTFPLPNRKCKYIGESEIIKNNDSRASVLLPITTERAHTRVSVIPFFPGCQNYCQRHQKLVDCIRVKDSRPTELVARTKILIILFTLLFTVCGLAVAVFCIWKHGQLMTPVWMYPSGLQRDVKVLVVYPEESLIFQKTVLSFADFLHNYCNADVILDLWQKRRVAEVGPVQWLVTQKEAADKIIFLSSSSRKSHEISSSIPNKTSHKDVDSSENIFPLALNLFCCDLLNPSCLSKYMVVSFSEMTLKSGFPNVLQTCSKYCLLEDIDNFCKDLHNVSRNQESLGKKLAPNIKKNVKYLQKLQKAVLEQKQWQPRSPDSMAAEHGEKEQLVAFI
ncbi:interleukin-17 receptor B isoform X2 [Ambystoma mexicanum]